MKTIQQLAGDIARASTSTKPSLPCAAKPEDWDLDIGAPNVWFEAVRTCHGCLILAQCREHVATLTARGMAPRSMIWAGVAYDGFGKVIANLDRYRAGAIVSKAPSRIVRIGPAYVRSAVEGSLEDEFCTTSPRRTVDVRRARLIVSKARSRIVRIGPVYVRSAVEGSLEDEFCATSPRRTVDVRRARLIVSKARSRIVRIGPVYVRSAVEGSLEDEFCATSPRRTVHVRRAAVGANQYRELVAAADTATGRASPAEQIRRRQA